jgi:hypothetical protein
LDIVQDGALGDLGEKVVDMVIIIISMRISLLDINFVFILAQHRYDILIVSTYVHPWILFHSGIMTGSHVISHLTLSTAINVRTRFFASFLACSSPDVLDFKTAAINGHVPLSLSLYHLYASPKTKTSLISCLFLSLSPSQNLSKLSSESVISVSRAS